MNVGDICNRLVIYIAADESVQRAAELMRKYHVGNLVVTESGEDQKAPVGIVTDRDIVVEVVAKDIDAEELTVADIMAEDPLVAAEGDDIDSTLDAMREQGVRRVPVVDAEQQLVGVLALDDVLQLLASQIHDMASIVRMQRQNETRARA